MTDKWIRTGFAVVLLVSVFICGSASASLQPVLFFDPDIVESNTGDDNTISLIIDGAMRGLSGYGVIIGIDRPDIADITRLNLPDWAGIRDVRKLNSSAYLIQGTDIHEMHRPGALNIPLAEIRIHARAPGYATITASPIAIDDDQKGRYLAGYASGSIIITGAGPVPIIPMTA